MNTAYFRQLYAYHFALNRKLWHNSIMTLSDEQFVQHLGYSLGSIAARQGVDEGAACRWVSAVCTPSVGQRSALDLGCTPRNNPLDMCAEFRYDKC